MNIKIPERWGVNREEMIDQLVENYTEQDFKDLLWDISTWFRFGVTLVGFNNYTDDQLIDEYAVYVRGESVETCLSCHSIMVLDEIFEQDEKIPELTHHTKFRCVNADCNKTI